MAIRSNVLTGQSRWVAVLLAGVLAAAPVLADEIESTGATNNDWNTGSNWDGGVVPDESDIAAFFNLGGTNLNVTLSSSSTIGGLAFNANAVDPVTINVTNSTPLTLGSIFRADARGIAACSHAKTNITINNIRIQADP